MAWVKRRQDAEVDAAVRTARSGYPPEYGKPDALVPPEVRADSIVTTHSLLPKVLAPLFVALREMFDPALPLTRRQHEMIATVVSAANDCFY